MSRLSLTPEAERAIADLEASHAAGRLAHGYIITGAPEGDAGEVVRHFAASLLEAPLEQLETRQHADVLWVEPESKSRVIVIEQVRDMNHRMSQTSYAGGWKIGVLLHADRLHANAANAFLKTLEEPPPKSLLFLVTEKPEALLPTILSRCQRVVLGAQGSTLPDTWREALMSYLSSGGREGLMEALAEAGKLKQLLDEVREAITEEEMEKAKDEDVKKDVMEARVKSKVIEVRTAMLQIMEKWARDVWLWTLGEAEGKLFFPDYEATTREQAAQLTPQAALSRIESVENTMRQLGRNLPEASVLELAEMTQHFTSS